MLHRSVHQACLDVGRGLQQSPGGGEQVVCGLAELARIRAELTVTAQSAGALSEIMRGSRVPPRAVVPADAPGHGCDFRR